MSQRTMFVTVSALIAIVATPCWLQASFVDPITVTINGASPVDATTYNDGANKSWVNIAGNYTFGTSPNTYTITIAPKCTSGASPENLARVEGGNDGPSDILTLKNVKITISSIPSPAPEHLISFWGIFNPDPVTDPTQNPELRVAYRNDGGTGTGTGFVGTLLRGLSPAVNDKVRARGALSVEDPAGSQNWMDWWSIEDGTNIELNNTVTCTTSNCEKFFKTPNKIEKNWDSSTSSVPLKQRARKVKGDFWFTLTDTRDILSIPPNCSTINYFQIKDIPAFGPPPAKPREGDTQPAAGGTGRTGDR